jgi:hypothetical protein
LPLTRDGTKVPIHTVSIAGRGLDLTSIVAVGERERDDNDKNRCAFGWNEADWHCGGVSVVQPVVAELRR